MHWYRIDERGEAQPFYEVEYADTSKGMRPATLADARKVGAFPSPNTVMNMLASYGLEKWRREQYGKCVADAMEINLRCVPWEIIVEDAEQLYAERMAAAPDAGTDIHCAVENAICERMGTDAPHPPKDVNPRIVQAALDWLDERGAIPIAVEKVFVNPQLGIGGKLDLLTSWLSGGDRRWLLVDWKSIETVEDKPIRHYPKDKTPILAAYARGLGYPQIDCANVFLSRNEPGRVDERFYSGDEMAFGWNKFQKTYELWCVDNQYDPRIREE